MDYKNIFNAIFYNDIDYIRKHPEEYHLKDSCNYNTLYHACHLNNNLSKFEIIKILVESEKVGINSVNINNSTALHSICFWSKNDNNYDIIEYLIDHGANYNTKDWMNDTPLEILKHRNINYYNKIMIKYFNKVNNR